MEVGETVVLVGDVDGMPAGKEGRVIKVRDDMLLIGLDAAPLGLQMFLVFGNSGRERRKLGVLTKAR